MQLDEILLSRRQEFIGLCKSHDVSTLFAFGSVVTNRFDDERSDIDLLVELDEIDPLLKGEKLMSLWDGFEVFFQRKVDLLTKKALKNPFLIKSIDNSKVLIYDRQA